MAANRHPEKWEHPTDPDPLRRTVVAAINTHGWAFDGIPGVLPLIYKELESGRVTAFSTFNDLPFTDITEVRANSSKWYVTRQGGAQLMKAIVPLRVGLGDKQYEPRITPMSPDQGTAEKASVAANTDRPTPARDVVPTSDAKLSDLQQTYDELYAKAGKAPSQRAVHKHSGYARDTVRARWAEIRKRKPTKIDQ